MAEGNKKADVAETPEGFDHVGLLFNQPPGTAGLPFNESSEIPFNDSMKPISNGHRLHAAGSIPFGTEEVQSVFVLRLGGIGFVGWRQIVRAVLRQAVMPLVFFDPTVCRSRAAM